MTPRWVTQIIDELSGPYDYPYNRSFWRSGNVIEQNRALMLATAAFLNNFSPIYCLNPAFINWMRQAVDQWAWGKPVTRYDEYMSAIPDSRESFPRIVREMRTWLEDQCVSRRLSSVDFYGDSTPFAFMVRAMYMSSVGGSDRSIMVVDFIGPPDDAGLPPIPHTSTTAGLARYAYESNDFSVMPLLGDALQDDGYDDQYVLGRLRDPRPLYRGFWLVDELCWGDTH